MDATQLIKKCYDEFIEFKNEELEKSKEEIYQDHHLISLYELVIDYIDYLEEMRNYQIIDAMEDYEEPLKEIVNYCNDYDISLDRIIYLDSWTELLEEIFC